MRIKLCCLACGHPMELGDAYEDYEGDVRCWGCRAVLEVTLREGKLRSMKRSTGTPTPGPSDGGEPESCAPTPAAPPGEA